MDMYIEFPDYMEALLEELQSHDFIVHSFPLAEGQSVYSPSDYIYNKTANGDHYELVIDTNIFHFLLCATKGVNKKKPRLAVGLVAFCQLAGIEIEPAMAVYELINYDKTKAQEVVEKFLLFEKINNADNAQLAEYCLGLRDDFELPDIPLRDKNSLVEELTKYRRLKGWDDLYLTMLKIIKLKISDSHKDEKVVELSKWMFYQFRLVLPATVYSTFLFGKNPIKKMMKYKVTDTAESSSKSIINMTWDLFIITQYFRKWIDKEANEQILYCSDDKAFREILRLGIDVYIAKDISPLQVHLKNSVYSRLKEIYEERPRNSERALFTTEDRGAYRSNMIDKYERDLGIKNKRCQS